MKEESDNEDVTLIGDINFFFSVDDDNCIQGEINVMIAESTYRRRGLAQESILLFLHYAVERLHVSKFMCKISRSNEGSISLFQRCFSFEFNNIHVTIFITFSFYFVGFFRLGFKEVAYVAAFDEFEYQYNCSTPEMSPHPKESLRNLGLSQVLWVDSDRFGDADLAVSTDGTTVADSDNAIIRESVSPAVAVDIIERIHVL